MAAAALACLLTAPPAWSAMTGAAAFSRLDPGARSAALCGAPGTLETGPAAAFINPAGLAWLDHPISVTGDTGLLPFGQHFNYLGAAAWIQPEVAVGAGALFYGSGNDIEYRTINTFDADFTVTAQSSAWVLAAAARFLPPINAGISVRYLRDAIGASNASAFSSDAGITYTPFRFLSIGMAWQDYLGSTMEWSDVPATDHGDPSGAAQEINPGLRLGGAADFGTYRVTLDCRQLTGPYRRLGGGLEWVLHRLFTLRGGYDGNLVTFGFGTRYGIRDVADLTLDYAFAEAAPNDYQNRFTLTIGMAVPKLEKGRMLFPVQTQ